MGHCEYKARKVCSAEEEVETQRWLEFELAFWLAVWLAF